ncbi:MAG: UDP-N-acetylmuramate dehydrogenase [Ruminococcaceae bacterium]|nr:UDP-N-acetylmuramate dehydrogenase [Oscillospiraceae bacterium]
MNSEAYKKISSLIEIEENIPMHEFTGFQTGGVADYYVAPTNKNALVGVLEILSEYDEEYFLLGNGTNVICSDDGYRGTVVHTSKFKTVNFNEPNVISVSSGYSINRLCKIVMRKGLAGLEFAYGIPGTLGGAVFMNAGAYGGELSNIVQSATAFDKSRGVIELDNQQCEFGYRKSLFSRNVDLTIISAVLKLEIGDVDEIDRKMTENYVRRVEKQPLNFPSCGSTFKRPVGDYASRLIDLCNLKGYSYGGAQVSEKHAGFIINRSNATTNDILGLADYVSKTVKEMTNVELEMEVRVME